MSDLPTIYESHPEHPRNRHARVENVNTRGVKRVATSDFHSNGRVLQGNGSFQTQRFVEGRRVTDRAWFSLSGSERERLAYTDLVVPAK